MLRLLISIVLFAICAGSLGRVDATCHMNQLDGFFGNVSRSNVFETANWALTSNPASNDTCLHDNCLQNCQPNVVLTLALETIHNTFTISVNGQYLLSDGTWGCSGSFLSGCYTNQNSILMINLNTTLPSSSQTYFTGQFNTPWNDPSYGSYVTNSGAQSGFYSPIYQVPYPNWECPSTQTNQGDWGQGGSTGSAVIPASNWVEVYVAFPWSAGFNIHCSESYIFDVTRSCSSTVRGDPQFRGLRNQDYQVHGIDGGKYNIISAPTFQMNSEFIWLDKGDCPIIPSTNRKSVACFSHAGSYLKNLGMMLLDGTKILIESGPSKQGFSSVKVNDKEWNIGDSAEISSSPITSLHYNSTHEVTLVVDMFTIEIESSDLFLNLRSVALESPASWNVLKDNRVHGLLGQTWQISKTKSAIEGKVDDYLIVDDDLFGTDFIYNRFNVDKSAEQEKF